MTEMDFRQSGFTIVLVDHLLEKNKERIQKLKEPEDSRYIYHNELDNVCFQHDMA